MKQLLHKHSLSTRWFHWINFPLLAVMIWSGLLIYYANEVYGIRVSGMQFFSGKLIEGMSFHFAFMWIFTINGVLYVLYTALSGEWRELLSFRKTTASGKYKRPQRLVYSAIILMGIGSVLTGIAIYKPVQYGWLCALLGGYKAARFFHFLLTIGYCLFFLVHVTQVIRTGWNNFRAMITGFDITTATDNEKVPETNNQNVKDALNG